MGRVDDVAPARIFVEGPLRPKGVIMLQQRRDEGVLFRPGNIDVIRAHTELR